MDAIQKAKTHKGRSAKAKKLTAQQIAELQHRRKQGALIKTLMKEYRISKATVFRYLKESHSSSTGENNCSPSCLCARE